MELHDLNPLWKYSESNFNFINYNTKINSSNDMHTKKTNTSNSYSLNLLACVYFMGVCCFVMWST